MNLNDANEQKIYWPTFLYRREILTEHGVGIVVHVIVVIIIKVKVISVIGGLCVHSYVLRL